LIARALFLSDILALISAFSQRDGKCLGDTEEERADYNSQEESH